MRLKGVVQTRRPFVRLTAAGPVAGLRHVLHAFTLLRAPGVRVYVLVPLLINVALFSAALAGTAGRGTSRITGGAPGPAKVATRMLVMSADPQGRGSNGLR